jgi:hypothetical protein
LRREHQNYKFRRKIFDEKIEKHSGRQVERDEAPMEQNTKGIIQSGDEAPTGQGGDEAPFEHDDNNK